MKKISRLTALLLALLLILQMTAVAEGIPSVVSADATPIPQNEFNADIFSAMSEGAEAALAAVDTVRGWGITANADTINMRAYPNMFTRVLAELSAGTLVTVYDTTGVGIISGEWYKVSYNGQEGYIHNAYLNLCTCNPAEGAGLDVHADGCPDKTYYRNICAKSAEEIYADWNSYTVEGQNFILLYLSWTNQEKFSVLQALLTPPVVEQEITGTVGVENTITVSGNISRGASLSVEAVSENEIDAIENVLAVEEDFEEGYETGAFEISLEASGVSARLGEDGVVVTIEGLNVGADKVVEIVHFLDDVEAIKRSVNDGNVLKYTDEELISIFSKEVNAAVEATGERAIYVEKLTSENGDVVIGSEGSISFTVDSFSKYFYTIGNYVTTHSSEVNDSMWGVNGDIYYVIPGTTLSFRQDQNWKEEGMDSWFSGTSKPVEREYFTWEYQNPLPTDEKDDAGNVITRGQNHFRIHADAAGQTITLICSAAPESSGLKQEGNQTITIKVLSVSDFAAETFKGTSGMFGKDPALTFVVQRDSTYVPNEPIRNVTSEWVYIEDYNAAVWTMKSGTGCPSGLTALKLVKSKIAQSSDLKNTTDSTNTIGSVESAYGTMNKSYTTFTDAEWHKFLKAAVAYWEGQNKPMIAAGGDVVTSANVDEMISVTDADGNKTEVYRYQIWPHVIKLHTGGSNGTSIGWHVDCSVARVDYVSLSYDRNLVGNIQQLSRWNYPSSSMKQLNPDTATFDVGYPTDANSNSANMNVGSKLRVWNPYTGEEFEYTFMGWNTKQDGTGDAYTPGSQITISKDTVLYAQWTTTQISGTLKIVKNIEKAYSADELPNDVKFGFTVNFTESSDDSKEYVYNLYEGSMIVSQNQKMKNGDTLMLEGGQYVVIDNVPIGEVSVTEAVNEHYTSSWEDNTYSGTVTGGNLTEIVCTNTYKKHKGDLTIKKQFSGCNPDTDEAHTFTVKDSSGNVVVEVAIKGADEVTIKDLLVGEYTVTENATGAWRYTVTSDKTDGKVAVTADGGEIIFTNTLDNDQWLDGSAYAENSFGANGVERIDRGGER